MTILAIESTCDETGAAVGWTSSAAMAALADRGIEILSDVKASSAEIHAKYGGVIPEIAAREQVAAVIPVVAEALESAKLTEKEIEAVAVSEGPGLIGSLLIGVETAKAVAYAWRKPLIRVNHLAAHVFANWIVDDETKVVPELPAVALIVSGGHTDIMLMRSLTDWEWIGGTRDDAAGEAFDKAARAMDFPYPGGPLIAKAAEIDEAVPDFLKLPRPMIAEPGLEMSFSGLKTALVQKMAEQKEKLIADHKFVHLLAKEFNQAVADVLVKKTIVAVESHRPKSLILAGGVAANKMLREGLAIKAKEAKVNFFVPELRYCTDNAAMIAACALMRPEYIDPLRLRPDPGLEVR